MRLDVSLVACRLLKRRVAMGMDQEQVADRSKRSRAYISRLERGIVPNPTLLDLEAVALALEMSVAELLRPPTTDPDIGALRPTVEAIFGPDDGELVSDAMVALARGDAQQRRDALPIFRLLKKALDGQS